ncbi:hypothetical protein [Shewanella sp. Scap07]|uniref:hypothetical protein n=1 Tax=Shewanella sp. Scap07 TaxID=2589987 RepID=UPI001C4D0860|nr:hypothetical protein [Shewanella sp. Scap07]
MASWMVAGFRLPGEGYADAISGRCKHFHVRSTVASDVKGFTNAAVTWMSKSGHATNALSRICTELFVSSN